MQIFELFFFYPSDQSQVDTFRKMKLSEKTTNRSSHPEVFCKKMFLDISQNSQEFTGWGLQPS